jgi:hypothetical protein
LRPEDKGMTASQAFVAIGVAAMLIAQGTLRRAA